MSLAYSSTLVRNIDQFSLVRMENWRGLES